jgi:hypothetical protein
MKGNIKADCRTSFCHIHRHEADIRDPQKFAVIHCQDYMLIVLMWNGSAIFDGCEGQMPKNGGQKKPAHPILLGNDCLHLRLQIILQSDFLNQFKLRFQPVDVFFLAFQDM